MKSLVDTVIDNEYRIEEILANSSLSTVCRAVNLRSGEAVAVKFIGNTKGDQNLEDRFIREIRLLQSLKHPHIVPILTFGVANKQLYLVMPFIDGQSLVERMEQKRFTPDDTLAVANQIADALALGHQQQVVHRDVKPDNILCEMQGDTPHYYLIDFGLAKRPGIDSNLTATGTIPGTPEYMSPEHIVGEGIDPRSDIYSFGILLFELLLGVLPFEMKDAVSTLKAHMYVPPPKPKQLSHNFPESLQDVVLKCLAKKPEARYQTIKAMLTEFNTAINQLNHNERQNSYWII